MSIRRYRHYAPALCLLVMLGIHGSPPCGAADDAPFRIAPTASKPLISRRPSPYYDAVEPVDDSRKMRTQRLPEPVDGAEAMSASSEVVNSNATLIGELDTQAIGKTPLPDSSETDEVTPSSSNRGRSGFSSSIFWAIGILAAGWIARQLLKSSGSLSPSTSSPVELLSRQTIGPQQQLALVRFGRRVLLVGTTPTGMSTLATIEDPVEVQAIVAELRPTTTRVGPTLLDLFRSPRSEPARDTAASSVTLTSDGRSLNTDRRKSPAINREVADV